jgi:O-antigen ligase
MIIIFIWAPVFLHFCFFFSRYREFDRIGGYLYLIAAAWFSFVVVYHARDADDLRELKMPFYAGLTLLGFFAVAYDDQKKFTNFLLVCAVLGGFGAWASWAYFYIVEGKSLLSRHPTIGLWNVIIPAAQATGALMLLVVCLGLREMHNKLFNLGFAISLAGYSVFLISNQSRGVWIALFLAIAIMALMSRNKKIYLLFSVLILSLGVVFVLDSDVFLKRGVSFRSEIWEQGIVYARNNWLVGLGFDNFILDIESTKKIFDHPHNMYIDIAIRFGSVGLISWLLLWSWAFVRAYQYRSTDLGRATLVLLVYSSVVVQTDGVAQWMKPNPGWFVTWLPLALAFALGSHKQRVLADKGTAMEASSVSAG